MILQSLVHLYDELSRQGKVAREGWGIAKVSHRLVLDEEGGLIGIVSARKKVLRGKKEKEIPSDMMVPLPATRSSGVKANFLCDNSSYFLGVDNKGKPERTKECFEAARALHHQILDGCHSAEARAILSYFDHWDVAGARDNPLVQTNLEDILGGSNFLFHVGNKDVSDIPEIRDAWERYYRSGSGEEDTIKGQCLITGKRTCPLPRSILKSRVSSVHRAAGPIWFPSMRLPSAPTVMMESRDKTRRSVKKRPMPMGRP